MPDTPHAMGRTTRGARTAGANRCVRRMPATVRAGTFLGVPDIPLLGLGLAALGRPGYINLGHGSDVSKGESAAPTLAGRTEHGAIPLTMPPPHCRMHRAGNADRC
jgi:hypothetical protein